MQPYHATLRTSGTWLKRAVLEVNALAGIAGGSDPCLDSVRDEERSATMPMIVFSRLFPCCRIKSMNQKYLTVALIFAFSCLTVSASQAQLGPKDGVNLQPTDLERVKVGDIAPDFTLENMEGRRVTLSEVYSKKKVVLVFYRGQW
jgi:AhpC/TSA family